MMVLLLVLHSLLISQNYERHSILSSNVPLDLLAQFMKDSTIDELLEIIILAIWLILPGSQENN